MSNALVSLLLAVGGATWIYTKVMRRSGNNTQQSLVVAGMVAAIIFVVVITLLDLVFH
ncbi:MAG: hypothetical protein JWS12_454 [Candidatus Saccharibacteria bacterium]|nr:hypothetical protein [Candidatus Saccharibacteria bacterium]